ncbi:TAXI family TRAP transporter solute-binding subunit [Streptomyces sp. NPDC057702]|uniref:TAXI family TRAP transporter solute-binding subunit n=1 Tax=unclassified Streptomyces TaxID=2593676 RepID=UPI0036A1439A
MLKTLTERPGTGPVLRATGIVGGPGIGRARRLWRLAVSVTLALGLLLWWLLPLEDTSSPSGNVTITTGVRTGVYARYGELLKDRLKEDLPRLNVRLEPSEGSLQNIRRVAEGEAAFTIATADAVATYRDQGGAGAHRLRACARLYDDYMQLVVPAGSTIRRTADLAGRRVAIGQPGSGVSLIAGRLLTAAGLDPAKDLTPVPVGISQMTTMLREKKIDAFFWSGGLPTNAVVDLAQRMSIRLVPLGDLVDRVHRLGGAKHYYRAAVMPPDAYASIQKGQAVKTIAVANLLVTTSDTDEKLTEGVTRTVINSRDAIGETVHAAQRVDLRTAIYTDPLDLHQGAKHYYRSVKP